MYKALSVTTVPYLRLNATAFVKFLVFPMRRLLNGGVYFDIADNSYCKSFINVV